MQVGRGWRRSESIEGRPRRRRAIREEGRRTTEGRMGEEEAGQGLRAGP